MHLTRYINGSSTTSTARTQEWMTTKDSLKGAIGNINEAENENTEEWNGYNDEEYYDEYNEDDMRYIIQMVNKGKGKRKSKGKNKGKDKGGKDSKTVTCYTCGQQGHISPNCPHKKGKGGKNKTGGPNKGHWYDGKGSWQPQSYGYQQQGYSGYSGQPLNTGQPPANGYNTKGKGYGKPPPWNKFGKGKKGQIAIIGDYQPEGSYDPNAYNESQDWSYAYDPQWNSWN
eukprot:6491032-Amphidinium_carterae.1